MALEDVGPGRAFGSYEVLEELGRGGMGRVFRARHVTLERDVALKLLAEQYAEDDFYVQRFLKEARAAARLNHPGIVQIYDFGQVGPHWFLAMELVEGRSLSHFLKTHPDFMAIYPTFINDALGMFFTGFGKPKGQLYKDILKSLTNRRPLFKAVGDIVAFGRTIIGI